MYYVTNFCKHKCHTEYSLRETDVVSRDNLEGAVEGTASYNPLAMTDLKPWQGRYILVELMFTFIIIISSSCCYYLTIAGHELNMSSMMSVICKVKDAGSFARHIKMPDDRIKDIFSGPASDIVGKLASYCLESKLSWALMKEYLSISNEFDAIEITETMEQYNHEGT